MATTTKVIPAMPESTIATGDIIYWDTDQFQKVSVSTAGKVLTTVLGKPAWIDSAQTSLPDENTAKVKLTSDTTMTTGSYATVGWTAEAWDGNTMHDNSTNNSRVVAKVAGRYLIIAMVSWESATSNETRIRRYNSSNVLQETQTGGGTKAVRSDTAMMTAAVNDYFTVDVIQESGGDLDLFADMSSLTVQLMVKL